MRHRNLNKHFGRNSSQRKELLETLARNTIIHTKIKTTLAKAKEASKLVDKMVTLGKKDTVAARRMAFVVLQDRTLVARLFNQIAPLFNLEDRIQFFIFILITMIITKSWYNRKKNKNKKKKIIKLGPYFLISIIFSIIF